jgi:hypothetical protein
LVMTIRLAAFNSEPEGIEFQSSSTSQSNEAALAEPRLAFT